MGVPVVSLAGNKHISRVGLSQLSNVGLPELVATDPADYVEIAVRLARDTDKISSLRSRLRDMMSGSPLMNAKDFTFELEENLNEIWDEYVENAESPSDS